MLSLSQFNQSYRNGFPDTTVASHIDSDG